MLARVVTIQVKPEQMDECIRIFKEVNAPSIAARPGFDHGHWWADRTGGQATSVTFKPDGKVLFGVDDQTAFDPELSCPAIMPETGGIVSPLQLGGILFALAGGLAVIGAAAFVAQQRIRRSP